MRKIVIAVVAAGLACPAFASDTELSGFADGSYVYDVNMEAGEFGVDQVELDVVHHASEKATVRADLEWVKDDQGFVAQVEQAYMAYTRSCGTTFTFGQFNAPIGFELLDPPDMYQFSHSLVFDYALPTNVTGLAAARALGAGFDIVAYVCNGWDRNAEDNKHPTFGGRLGYTGPGGAALGLSAISGKEDADLSAFTRTVFDVDLTYKAGAWTFGGEFNKGTVTLANNTDQDWTAFLVMAHVMANEWLGLTGRFDSFDDTDGYAFNQAQTRSSLTFAPTFVLDDGLSTLVEVRLDSSGENVWTDSDGKPTDHAVTLALEVTSTW
jgi:hypothetical protein